MNVRHLFVRFIDGVAGALASFTNKRLSVPFAIALVIGTCLASGFAIAVATTPVSAGANRTAYCLIPLADRSLFSNSNYLTLKTPGGSYSNSICQSLSDCLTATDTSFDASKSSSGWTLRFVVRNELGCWMTLRGPSRGNLVFTYGPHETRLLASKGTIA